jgi:hypothetical protein
MDPVHYEVATVAAARELRSSCCSLAHGSELASRLVSIPRSRSRVTSRQDPAHAAIGELGPQGRDFASWHHGADLKPLRDLELSDVDILDVVLTAAARCFFQLGQLCCYDTLP